MRASDTGLVWRDRKPEGVLAPALLTIGQLTERMLVVPRMAPASPWCWCAEAIRGAT